MPESLRRVLEQITGVTDVTPVDNVCRHTVTRFDGQQIEVNDYTDYIVVRTPDPESPPARVIALPHLSPRALCWELYMLPGFCGKVVGVWADPSLTTAQRNTRLADLANRTDGSSIGMGAPDMFGVPAYGRYDWVRIMPHRDDGRFTFAGFLEPFPGCWPADAVDAAERGDLSLLWPYLDRTGEAP